MAYDWRNSRGSQETQAARAIMCHFLEDCGFVLSDAVRHGDRDPALLDQCRAEAQAAGLVVPVGAEMVSTAKALIRRETRGTPDKAVQLPEARHYHSHGAGHAPEEALMPLLILGGAPGTATLGSDPGPSVDTGTWDPC